MHAEPDEESRKSSSRRGYDRKWRKFRKWYLTHNPICEARIRCRGRVATEIDHIVPMSKGGDRFASHNLQAICIACHKVKSMIDAGYVENVPRCILVCGPPGSGKSTYAKANMRAGDLVVDMDELFRTLSGVDDRNFRPAAIWPFVRACFDRICELLTGVTEIERAYIVTGLADYSLREKLRRRLRAELVLLETPLDVCIKRIRGRKGSAVDHDRQIRWATNWHRKFEETQRDDGQESKGRASERNDSGRDQASSSPES